MRSMRQALGTEDAPSSMLTRLRMRMRLGIDGAPHRGDGLSFEIELTFRDRSLRPTSIGSMDRGGGRVRRMLRPSGFRSRGG
ncbi:hypothetical protein TROUBLE_94 [Mycobacterium phage Trouble]|uniref:hypothetical protein n=1 Tax=Mycobacterium phage Trouble TaxID=1340825 RepID=UPI000387F38C|nr:hypothetical protein N854_gp94 [Mycobacterium phage Trouble]AGT12606.1 hypothetical protein TROUBLE_94 [Mycobacterium phage Trouble]